ncbi:MAG: winged helix-turn-helix transcriptional regulator [Syntrophomonadaceae bacterium]|nr:winged helix-turn-helix transcriptional regulator [Syntrophomonadaceae bacterium]
MRLTSREQEIVNVIKKNPLISQDELAEIFDISRSSVAVHISNLMKKGIIRGKGYEFNEEPSITILGDCYLEINIDNKVESDSRIDIKYCGVPIEIGSIFTNYGIKPRVVTFLGNDDIADYFLNQLYGLEIDIANIFKHTSKRTSRCVKVNNDLTYRESLQWDDYLKAISTREWIIYNCDWLIHEYRFTDEKIRRALNKKTDNLPRFCTFKILDDIRDISDNLSYYSVVVLGIRAINDSTNIVNKLLELNSNSEQVFVITDGKSDIITISNNTINSFPLLPNQVFSIENKLSSFLAGLIYGILNNHPLRQAIRIAIGSI